MTDDELKALVASLAESEKLIDDQLQHTSETSKIIAIEFFYNALKDNQSLGGIFYDFIDKSFSRSYNGITDTFDK